MHRRHALKTDPGPKPAGPSLGDPLAATPARAVGAGATQGERHGQTCLAQVLRAAAALLALAVHPSQRVPGLPDPRQVRGSRAFAAQGPVQAAVFIGSQGQTTVGTG